ncbi:MAG: nucleoside-diphosphate kinase [Nitrospinae bacterium RIFCSPLOWO2_12_39_16]|nr:MAG: nucleoside-diphosphate kinase [Bdellovibrionales bacterium RIFOXYB2_FULL_36_6]OGW05347.1 MAG: nucleoside-diphosphate kinase [Nitrospinae bacterium RIFCSPLOWO2_02_39_17]OGW08760.1 MAG: nucleoside-diphosphate kinase [Nitrospinae bacterium RIFCSPLOWO2_12_39_16]
MERTLAIIKPDAVERGLTGKILDRIESRGLKIIALKMLHITKGEAEGFYKVHTQRLFFQGLTTYVSSGTVVIAVLEGKDAIKKWRDLMGATNPKDAAAGTIRKDFAVDIEKNSVHGSDSPESASYEIPYFFSSIEIF